ncbi:MAG: phage tail tape measure protein [Candidatus Kapabacteria bacterium]|nr:phage tail tape measure protein [Ignavibacteriota bacterium]MCW5886414.1 phage tail tape measure protein [Candidatus Kapabacteria bacterium]
MDLSLKFKADVEVEALVKKLNIMIKELKTKLGEFGKGVDILDEANIKSQFQEVNKQFTYMTNNATKSKGAMEAFEKSINNTAKSGSVLGKVLMFTQVTQAISQVSAAFDQFLGPYQEFDKQLKNIGTLGVKNFDEFRNAAIDLASGVPDTVAGVTEGIYNAISAGAIEVVDGQADVANGMKFIEQASKLAVAGMTDTNSAIKGLASVTNAYGVENLSASTAADTLFAIVKNGVTTVPELNASLSNVVPIAAAAGISFDEVGAAIATMTKQGVPTAQATTKIRAAIAELMKPGANLKKVMNEAGVSMETLQKEGLVTTMQKLGTTMNAMGTDAANTFSSIEAVGFALSSTGENASKFASDLDSIKLGAGSVEEAFGIANEGISVQVQGVLNQIEAGFFKMFGALGDGATGMIALTNKLAPTVATFAGLGTLLPIDKLKDFGAAALSKVVPGMTGMQKATQGATSAQKAFNLAMLANPVFLTVAGIVALVAATKLLSDALHETAKERLDDAKSEQDLLKTRIDTNRQERVLAKSKLDMVDAFESQGKAAMKNQELMVSLSKSYPGVISTSKSYEENLKALKIASEEANLKLGELNDELTNLAQQSIEMDFKIKKLEVDVAKGEIENELQDALGNVFDDVQDWIFGTSDSRIEGEKLIKSYTDAIYNAKNDGELQKAGIEFRMAMTGNEDLTPKEQANLDAKIKDMINRQGEVIKSRTKDIEKDLATLKQSGFNDDETADQLSKLYNVPKEKITEMIEKQKESKALTDEQTEAAEKLGDAWDKANKSVADNIKTGLSGVNELAMKLKDKSLTKEARAEIQKQYNESLSALKSQVKLKKQYDAIEEQSQYIAGLKTREIVAQYDAAKKLFDLEKKKISGQLESYQINTDLKRLQEGREKSMIDEVALLNTKRKALEDEKTALLEIYKVRQDNDGNIIDIGVSIGKNQKRSEIIEELNSTLSSLNNSITKNDINELELRAKVKLSNEELNEQIRKLELEQLKFDIDFGFKDKDSLVEFLEEDMDLIKKNIQEKQDELYKYQDQLKAVAGDSDLDSTALEYEISQIQKQLIDLQSKEIASKRTIEQEKRALRESSLRDLQEKHAQELEEIETHANATKEIMDIALKAVDAGLSKKSEKNKNNELTKLESQKENAIISEQYFNKRKEEIEAEHNRTLKNIQEAQRGAELEAERIQTQRILEEKKKRIELERSTLDENLDKERYQDLTKQLSELEGQLKTKGSLLETYSLELQGNMGEIFANLLGGDNEALKESAKDMFAFVAGILKKAAAATATKLILDQLTLTPGGFLALVATPGITAFVNVAISKILDPILSQITSFSTGGRVDEPTLAIVGDASRSRGGRDTEWITRDDQLMFIINLAIARYLDKFENSIRPLMYNLDMKNQKMSSLSVNEFGSLIDNNYNALTKMHHSIKGIDESLKFLPQNIKDNLTADKIIKISIESVEIKGLTDSYNKGEIGEDDYIVKLSEKQRNIKSYAGSSGFLYQPELAYIGDAGVNNPEIVLNNPDLKALVASVGSQSNAAVVKELGEVEKLLHQMLQKDTDIYLDSRKVTDEVQREFNRRRIKNN